MKGEVESKPSQYPEGGDSKGSTLKIKVQASKTKKYIGKKKRTKTQGPEIKADTKSKGLCSDLEGYIFDLWPIALEKLSTEMKELERYLGVMYNDICQSDIMTKTTVIFPDLYIPTIITDNSAERPKTDL